MLAAIVNDLEHSIKSGRYPSNTRLPSLNQMARSYKVSYGTAHAAVAALEGRGLVSMQPGRGTYVLHRGMPRFTWVWFGKDNIPRRDGVQEASLSYVQRHEKRLPEADDGISLELTFLDVRHLPPAGQFVESCRLRGSDGLIVSGFGREYADYVEEIGTLIPVVAPFLHGGFYNFPCVGPDIDGAVAAVLNQWFAAGAGSVGLLAPAYNHPNYRALENAVRHETALRGIPLREEDAFIGSPAHARTWMAGRLALANSPRHWIAAVEGGAQDVLEAARLLGLTWQDELRTLTFTVLPRRDKIDPRSLVAHHNFDLMIGAVIGQLRSLCQGGQCENQATHIPMVIMGAPENI